MFSDICARFGKSHPSPCPSLNSENKKSRESHAISFHVLCACCICVCWISKMRASGMPHFCLSTELSSVGTLSIYRRYMIGICATEKISSRGKRMFPPAFRCLWSWFRQFILLIIFDFTILQVVYVAFSRFCLWAKVIH